MGDNMIYDNTIYMFRHMYYIQVGTLFQELKPKLFTLNTKYTDCMHGYYFSHNLKMVWNEMVGCDTNN